MASPDNPSLVRIRDNATIQKLDIPKKDLEAMQQVMAARNITEEKKKDFVKKLAQSYCCVCHGIPTLQVNYDMQGITRIERYCDKCAKSVYEREPVL